MGLGSFALATSAVGWFAPGLGPRLVALYLGTSGLLAFLQVILVLGIFGAQQKVASAIAQADTTGRYTQCGAAPSSFAKNKLSFQAGRARSAAPLRHRWRCGLSGAAH